MGFFKPAWASKNASKAVDAVNRIDEQSLLIRVIQEAVVFDAKIAAIKRIKDEAILIDIMGRNYHNRALCVVIAECLTTQQLIINELETTHSEIICEYLLPKLKEQSVLNRLALWPSFAGRATAIKMISDPNTLRKIALERGHVRDSIIAVAQLHEQSLLLDIALHTQEYSVLQAVRTKLIDISDDDLLAVEERTHKLLILSELDEVYKGIYGNNTYLFSLELFKDTEQKNTIMKSALLWSSRLGLSEETLIFAVNNTDEKRVLEEVQKNNKYASVAKRASERLAEILQK